MTREEAIRIIEANCSCSESTLMEACAMFIPELREIEEERTRKRAIAILKQQRAYWSYDGPIDKFPPATPRKDLVDAIDVALSYLEKQKEQKPNYCHHEVDETGWTEEYRKAYYDGWNNCNMQHEQLKTDHKPAEWSEEDERIRKAILGFLNPDKGGTKYSSNAELVEWSDWLKSLRPSWRPSEEQMRALEITPRYFPQGCPMQVALISLYEQLKKL